ncbi:hypothetical protein RUND412_009975 [Rhizina undulata]
MESEDTKSQTRKTDIIKDYLANVQEFQDLCALRDKGWESEAADRHFIKQRAIADSAASNKKTQFGFYKKMLEIADEINRASGVFSSVGNERVLDVCMAPGAFSDYALRQNPGCWIDGITLPVEEGGHEILLQTNERKINISFTNLTLHSSFLPWGKSIPVNFPDRADFNANPPLPPLFLYKLVICDGQRLRTHEHADRRNWEAVRLLLSQLILGLTHIKHGGSMLILLHRVELWYTASMIYRFSKFSNVQLYKPSAAHATRSSFYMIASNVRPVEAVQWVEHLKDCWFKMTFNGEDGRGMGVDCAEDLDAEDLLRDFGPRLIQLGSDIWRKQRDALSSSKWIQGAGSSSIV